MHGIAKGITGKATRVSAAKVGPDSAGTGTMTDEQPECGALYSSCLQGDFYSVDYYGRPASDIESAIGYDDNGDKLIIAAMLVATARNRKSMEL